MRAPIRCLRIALRPRVSLNLLVFITMCVCVCSHVVCHFDFAPSHLSASARLCCLLLFTPFPSPPSLRLFHLSLCICLIVSPSHFTRQESPRQLLSICSPPPLFSISPYNSKPFLLPLRSLSFVCFYFLFFSTSN